MQAKAPTDYVTVPPAYLSPTPNPGVTPAAVAGETGLSLQDQEALQADEAALTQQATISQNEQDASGTITSLMQQLGMNPQDAASLGNWAMGEAAQGKSIAQISVDLYSQPAFIKATPGFAERVANGHPGMSASDYFAYKTQVQQMAHAAGFPAGFMTDQEIGKFVANNVSADEVSSRINDAFATSMGASPETQKAMQDYYGVGPGGVAAFYLDPEKGSQVLHQQATAALIGGAGAQLGFGEISQAQALAFAKAGGSALGNAGGALSALQGVAHDVPLTQGTINERPGSTGQVTTGQVLGSALVGDFKDTYAVGNAEATRTAPFRGGGGPATGTPGQPGATGSGTQ